MIDAITDWGPDLVSIDSPLSLPRGRRHVGDDDPTRDEFGIMRQCERTLKRRGINVYPCLLPSMQRLTARGIRLASTLRRLGVPVIESYPGAAQDIMNIPRKRAGENLLKDGLRLFGIKGDYLKQKVTHDELDAITSAIVGLYFWTGRFEALGDEREDYLIIPDIERTIRSPRIVGISGPIRGQDHRSSVVTGRRLRVRATARFLRISPPKKESCLTGARCRPLVTASTKTPVNAGSNTPLSRTKPGNTDLVIDGLRWPEATPFGWSVSAPRFATSTSRRPLTATLRNLHAAPDRIAFATQLLPLMENRSASATYRTAARGLIPRSPAPRGGEGRAGRRVRADFRRVAQQPTMWNSDGSPCTN